MNLQINSPRAGPFGAHWNDVSIIVSRYSFARRMSVYMKMTRETLNNKKNEMSDRECEEQHAKHYIRKAFNLWISLQPDNYVLGVGFRGLSFDLGQANIYVCSRRHNSILFFWLSAFVVWSSLLLIRPAVFQLPVVFLFILSSVLIDIQTRRFATASGSQAVVWIVLLVLSWHVRSPLKSTAIWNEKNHPPSN